MNYQETLDYLFSQLPMYQRVGQAAYKVDLSNTHRLMDLLDHPENGFKSVHLAGTNGKGSTSHMIASVLQEAGYNVGLYTSPHLKDFRERIRINGQMIPEETVVDFVAQHKNDFESIQLSFFEWTVGLAFHYFRQQQVDIAIIETGLGGRLDSTNVVQPEVSVITNIGFDHTQFLGDTLDKIAGEKAGIIKANTPVVIGEYQEEIAQLFKDKASKFKSPILFADQEVKKNYETDLLGSYQQKNVKTCVLTIKELIHKGWNISADNLKTGLKQVVKNTGLLGRWQVINSEPLTICDTGHNESGIQEILAQLDSTEFDQLHMVFGAVNDKSIDNILNLLPKEATYYFCQADIPRALDVNVLTVKANSINLSGTNCGSVANAIKTAQENADSDDLIFIGGSTFVVAEAI